MTNDLRRSCNETARNKPRLLGLRLIINILGFGSSVIARLLQTSIRKNLWFTIKDKVVEERVMGSAIHKRTQKTKVYGSDSTKAEREKLMEILRDRVEYHKDKIVSPTIYEELCGLEVKKNGKIEHSTNTHDDQVFSWLWALYIYYEGGDLMNNWGITKRVLRTDADLEEAVVDIQEDQTNTTQAIEIEENEEVNAQLEALATAPGQKMYEQWLREEHAKDEQALNKILNDRAAQKSLSERFQIMMNNTNNSPVQTIPTEVFLNFNRDDYEIEMQRQTVLSGNLSQYW